MFRFFASGNELTPSVVGRSRGSFRLSDRIWRNSRSRISIMSNKDKSGWKETPLVIRRRDAARLNRLAPGIMPSTYVSGTLFLKDFPWTTVQALLLLLLGFLLLAAPGVIWKCCREKEQECWTKGKAIRRPSQCESKEDYGRRIGQRRRERTRMKRIKGICS